MTYFGMKTKKKKKKKKLPHITPRSTKHDLSIKNTIKIRDGIHLIGKSGSKTSDHDPILIKMTISREDLTRLHDLTLSERDYFVNGFYNEFVVPCLQKMHKGARGKFKGKGTSLKWLKREACELYHLFSFLLKRKKQPSYFKKLLAMVKKLENSDQYYNSDKPDPIALTAFCVGTFFEKEYKKAISIKSILKRIEEGNLESFYKHYIKEEKPIFIYEDSPTDQALEELADEAPFSYIFKTLDLI